MHRARLVAAAVAAAVGVFAGSANAASTPVTRGVVLVTTNLAYENANAAGTGVLNVAATSNFSINALLVGSASAAVNGMDGSSSTVP